MPILLVGVMEVALPMEPMAVQVLPTVPREERALSTALMAALVLPTVAMGALALGTGKQQVKSQKSKIFL
jgi:hypothetical protein